MSEPIHVKELDMVKELKKFVKNEIYMYTETGANPFKRIVDLIIYSKDEPLSIAAIGTLIRLAMNAGKLEECEEIYGKFMQTGVFRDEPQK